MRGDADKNLKRKSRGLKKKKDAEEKGHEGLGTHVTGKTETREEKGEFTKDLKLHQWTLEILASTVKKSCSDDASNSFVVSTVELQLKIASEESWTITKKHEKISSILCHVTDEYLPVALARVLTQIQQHLVCLNCELRITS